MLKMIEMLATPMLGNKRDGRFLVEICQGGEDEGAHEQYFYLTLFCLPELDFFLV